MMAKNIVRTYSIRILTQDAVNCVWVSSTSTTMAAFWMHVREACCALCLGVVDWHHLGRIGVWLRIGLYNYTHFATLFVGMGPL